MEDAGDQNMTVTYSTSTGNTHNENLKDMNEIILFDSWTTGNIRSSLANHIWKLVPTRRTCQD